MRRVALAAVVAALAMAAFIGAASGAHAAPLGPGALDAIVNSFSGVKAFGPTLLSEAKLLFAGLALIEFVWVVGRQVIARADLGGILATVLFQVVTLGFFYWVVINGSQMMSDIVTSFAQLANNASTAAGGSSNMSPSDIFNAGLGIVYVVWNGISATTPGKDILLVIAGIIILYVFAVIAGMLIEVIVESMFVATAGVILLGFSGSAFVRNIAIAQFHLAISVGMKRLVLQILVGLAETMIRGWAMPSGNLDWTTIGVMIGAPVVLLRLVTTLPQRAQDMLIGAHSNMGRGLGGVPATAAALAGGAAASAVGGAAATAAAFREASATIAAREGAGSGGSISGGGSGAMAVIANAARVTGMAASNLGSAAATDIGQRMTGNYAAQHGRAGWRMAASMNTSAANLRAAMGAADQSPMANGTTQTPGNQLGSSQS